MEKMLTIEVRNGQIRVMKVRVSGKRIKILSCFRFPIPSGLIEDGYIKDTREVANILKSELAKRKETNIKKVAFSIFSNRIAGKEVELPYVKKKRLLDMIEVNASDYFPVDISQYILSYDILDIIGDKTAKEGKTESKKEDKKEGKKYRLMVYITPKTLIKGYQELAAQGGFTIEKINYSSHNVYRAVEKKFIKGTRMVMKIGEDETNITIIRDGKLALQRSLSYGMGQALDVIAHHPVYGTRGDYVAAWDMLIKKDCFYETLDEEVMESYKEKDGQDIWEWKCEVTESLRYLINNVSRIMDYYISRNSGIEFTSIQYGGLGSEVKGLSKLFSEELRQPVKPITDLIGISYNKQLSEQGDSIGTYISCIGCLYSDLNILENVNQKKKSNTDSLSGAWLILGAGALASIVLIGTSLYLKIQEENRQAYLDKEIAARQDVQVIYNNYLTEKANVSQLENIYSNTVTPNEYLVAFIEEMEEKMPSSIRIDSLSSTQSGVNFNVTVSTKEEAADVLVQLRTFNSLASVTTSGITQQNNGEIAFDVVCTYKNVEDWQQETSEEVKQ